MSCCAPQPLCVVPTQPLVQVLSTSFTTPNILIGSSAPAGTATFTPQAQALVFLNQCESTVTLTFDGMITFGGPESMPFATSIALATAASASVQIIDPVLSAQTLFAVIGESSPFTQPFTLAATIVLPAGTYLASLQLVNQFALNSMPSLVISGKLTATSIKTTRARPCA